MAAGTPAVRELRSELTQVFGAHLAHRGAWAVDVQSLDSGESLFQLDADKLMVPASNLKILTLAAAAETLGWDYRYTTTLEATGTVEDGVLHGDLIVRGSGDPTINSRSDRAAHVLDEWVAALAGAGIRTVDGRLIGNDQAFDDEGIGAGWAWDYLQYGYAAPAGALEYNEDVAALTVTPAASAGAPPSIEISAGSGLTLVNRASTSVAGSETTIDFRRRIDRPVLEVTGMIPLGSAPIERPVAVVNPTIFFVQSLKDALAAHGITVLGPAVDYDDVAADLAASASASPYVLVSTQSPPLREIAAVMMKVSQNLYAETLLKTVGAVRGGLGTVAAGLQVVRELLGAWGVPDDAYVLLDGSGLSRYNYVTASAIATVLEHMYRDLRHRDAFLSTLPIAGKDGTVSARMRGTRAEGNALAKTGSLSNVRTLSGYVRTRDGEMLVFSVLANDFLIPSATIARMTDLAIEVLANFKR